MNHKLAASVRYTLQGVLVMLVFTASTVSLTSVIVVLALFKLILPTAAARNCINRWSSALGEFWISINSMLVGFYRHMEWDVQLPDSLDRRGRYLVFCNHQSWVDIVVLQRCLNRRAPFMRFLLKRELIWVPFLGLAWWALDMVFLRRYSRQELAKNPALLGKDLENAASACAKLKHVPVSMMAFPEGTRFTAYKQKHQQSPYRHLLRPRYGGIGQVLYSFDDAMQELIDVTILYPQGAPTFWQFVSGQVPRISVRANVQPIDAGLRGKNFRSDNEARHQLRAWLESVWADKDELLDESSEL